MFKLALIQLAVTADKQANVARAVGLIEEAAKAGAKIVALPECFNSPYGTKYFPSYAETIPGETTDALAAAAKKSLVYLIGGSIPEQGAPGSNKYYNTATVFDPQGQLIAKHRKVHLFDIDVPGKIRFQESEVLSPGASTTHFDTEYGRFGLAICYDIRFPELAMIAQKDGCKMMFYPGAFNMTTGPLHWELLQRARALDNQFFVAAISPARDAKSDYVAWGHSTAVDPWGKVIATTEHDEAIVYVDIDLSQVDEIRQAIPVHVQKRHDLYELTRK